MWFHCMHCTYGASKAGILLPCDIHINSLLISLSDMLKLLHSYVAIHQKYQKQSWGAAGKIFMGSRWPRTDSECAVKCCTIRTPNPLERKGIAKRGAKSRLPCVNRAPEPRVKTHLNTSLSLLLLIRPTVCRAPDHIFMYVMLVLNNSNPQSNLRCHLEVDHFISFENRCRFNFHVSEVTTTKLTFALSHILASYHLPRLWHATFRCAPGVSDPI